MQVPGDLPLPHSHAGGGEDLEGAGGLRRAGLRAAAAREHAQVSAMQG